MKTAPLSLTLICTALASMASTARAVDAGPVFKIYVEHTGVYEVSYERLVESGLGGPLPSAAIGLRNFGSPVAVWVSDGGDGVFGRGDRVTFIGEVLRGTYSFLDPYSRFNCYRLSFDDEDPRRGESLTSARTRFEEPARFLAKHHLESDRVMVRFRMKSDDPEESWYWERLSVADKEPFRQELVFEGFARSDDNDRRDTPSAVDLAESVRLAFREDGEPAGRIRSASPIGLRSDDGHREPGWFTTRPQGVVGTTTPRANLVASPRNRDPSQRRCRRTGDLGWEGPLHH